MFWKKTITEIKNDIEDIYNKTNKQILKTIDLKENQEKTNKQIENDENKTTNLTKQMEKLVNENKEIKEAIKEIINAINTIIKRNKEEQKNDFENLCNL